MKNANILNRFSSGVMREQVIESLVPHYTQWNLPALIEIIHSYTEAHNMLSIEIYRTQHIILWTGTLCQVF